jgi:hypothetical protein
VLDRLEAPQDLAEDRPAPVPRAGLAEDDRRGDRDEDGAADPDGEADANGARRDFFHGRAV